ncbi:MAG: insulinase family protein [Bacteroidales bacterium]|nr:insulinase family protein [Bacteroidales bacterium]
MKKFLLSLLVILLTIPAMAQMGSPLPIDPKVRKGVLPNGLTYFIRHNAEPQGQAEFFIAQRVGSVQEEDNQRGLAHFLEHLAFNGTRHFPEKTSMLNYLESIGVKFGVNLNAYTSFDETVYNISAVPVSRQGVPQKGIIDSVLLVLWDWADGLLLTDEAIEAERGVIREEMRTRENAFMRIVDNTLPEIFPNSLYGQRFPIGTEEVIMNFKPDELRAYYRKWYRPDHQAIIVVGDIDPDYIEARIKEFFNQIPTPTTPSQLVPIPVEPNETPIVVIGLDPEMTMTQVSINFKYDPFPKEVKLSDQGLILNYVKDLITSMLNTRLSEITQKANAPFLFAQSATGKFFFDIAKTMNAFSVTAVSKEGGMAEAFQAMVTEVARAKQHGFTMGEFERANATFLSNLERAFNERERQRSVTYAREYVRNFGDDEPIPGIEFERNFFTSGMMSMIPPEQMLMMINMLMPQLVGETNIVIFGVGPEKDGLVYPTREELLKILTTTMATQQEAYQDEALDEPLIAQMPKAGKVTKTEKLDLFGAKVFTLSNNVKVIIKPTDFKDDEIRFTATSFGGNSLFDDKYIATFRVLNEIATIGGVGNFSRVNLTKALAGKQARVSSSVSTTTEGLHGNGSPRDLETIMQLIYLYSTSPRHDQEAFDSWLARMRAQLENLALNPMVTFQDTLLTRLYGDQPRLMPIFIRPIEELNQIDYKKAIELYKDRFKDMSDFTFTFVGNIDEKTFIPLMEQYIGALPNLNRKETFKKLDLLPLTGKRQSHFDREMQTVKATVATVYTGKADFTPENRLKFSFLDQILDIVYVREIRDKESGTYGVQVQCDFQRFPEGNYSLFILFDTDPPLAERLLAAVYRELDKLATEGPTQEDFDAVKAFMLKDTEERRRNNNAWLNAIDEYAMYKTDNFTKREEMINKLKPSDVQAIVKLILGQKNRAEVVMTGVEAN